MILILRKSGCVVADAQMRRRERKCLCLSQSMDTFYSCKYCKYSCTWLYIHCTSYVDLVVVTGTHRSVVCDSITVIPVPLTRYFHWWITAPYTNWMIDWLIIIISGLLLFLSGSRLSLVSMLFGLMLDLSIQLFYFPSYHLIIPFCSHHD